MRLLRSATLLFAVALSSACVTPVKPAAQAIASRHFTIRVESLPAITPKDVSVYVAGNFNGWNPGDTAFRLRLDANGNHVVLLPDSVRGTIEFKFTLGSWDAVETDSAGGDVENRVAVVTPNGDNSYTGRIANWRDPRTKRVREHTAGPTVSVISDAFEIPQLGRTRRVWIYLPRDYSSTTARYPVLYMHDGQNVFDNATSFVGEWGVDETLDSLAALGKKGVIVVAVDHGGGKRLDEYSPWKNTKYGGGEGDMYVEFLVKNLKPYIDSHFRTLPDRLNTGIAGSSMGGLISLYAILKYPQVFSRAGVFSPAFWFAPSLFEYVREVKPLPSDTRLYFVAGGMEGASAEEWRTYADDQKRMTDSLIATGLVRDVNVVSVIRPDGKHAEWFWRREFPAAFVWLFSW
jgi:metallo-beta-lactamase class B